MAWWSSHAVPRLTDRALSSDPIMRLRAEVVAGLEGRVLEIGYGSGLNTALYPAGVTSVAAVEPSEVAWRLSGRRRHASPVRIERTGLDGQHLEAEDASYDAVLSTFTLCTIPDAALALREVRRVLRPGGRLHFLEHGQAPDVAVARWQRRLDPVQRRVAAGCNLSRDMPALLLGAGLEIDAVDAAYLPGPGLGRPWSYVYAGTAGA